MPSVAYNPYDPNQAKLLGGIALSETGNAANAQNLGTGGRDLSHAPTDEYGFPQWDGITVNGRPSHAAGFFQFQPGTWAGYAAKFRLNFQNPEHQKAAAWYDAQDTYARETGGDLTAALKAGQYDQIEAALGKNEWTGARGKLAGFLSGGKVAALPDGTNPISDDTSPGGTPARFDPMHPFASLRAIAGDVVTRYLIYIVGTLLLLAAVWWLLSDAGVVPSAGTVAKTAVKVAAVAV